MKKILLPFLVILLTGHLALAGNWFGSGPWANATYYPGNLDGKYQASVFGNNISGVIGFALRDGAPTTTVTSQLNTTNNSSQATLTVDPFQNYFVIFVEGRTYTGISTASINYNNNTVTGALQGTQPDFTFSEGTNSTTTVQTLTLTNITNSTSLVTTNSLGDLVVTTSTNVFSTNLIGSNSIPISYLIPATLVNRGLNGGFRANIDSKQSVFTFSGNGQLSTPAQSQTVNFTTNAEGIVTAAQIQTDTVPFQLNGIRVSFSSASTGAASNSLAP